MSCTARDVPNYLNYLSAMRYHAKFNYCQTRNRENLYEYACLHTAIMNSVAKEEDQKESAVDKLMSYILQLTKEAKLYLEMFKISKERRYDQQCRGTIAAIRILINVYNERRGVKNNLILSDLDLKWGLGDCDFEFLG